MRAVVYRGPNDLRVEELPVPQIGPNDLLVRVAVCGVCPTDIKKIQYGTLPPPRVFGHETAGTIVRVGKKVKGFKTGERVALHHHVPCLECHACRHRAFAQCSQYKKTGITAGFEPAGGGYAEYVRVLPFVLPGVVRIPARNTFLEGAMLEPVNTVLKAVERLSLLPKDTVLVAGQGPIGLMFTRILALRGINVIATDLLGSRLSIAQEFGAKWLWESKSQNEESYPAPYFVGRVPSRGVPSGTRARKVARSAPRKFKPDSLTGLVDRVTLGQGLDAAVIAVPLDSIVHEAQELLRGGGQLLLFSHTRRGEKSSIDLATVCVDEKDLLGSYSADFTLQNDSARLVFSRKLDVRRIITHQFALEQTSDAVHLAAHPSNDSLKIVVTQMENVSSL